MSADRFAGDELAAFKAGQLDERLKNFDAHFAVVNGSIADTAHALEQLVLVVAEIGTKVKIAAYVLGAIFSALLAGALYLLASHIHPS